MRSPRMNTLALYVIVKSCDWLSDAFSRAAVRHATLNGRTRLCRAARPRATGRRKRSSSELRGALKMFEDARASRKPARTLVRRFLPGGHLPPAAAHCRQRL